MRPPGGTWVGIAGLDLVRDASGELLVLEDNLRTPSGFAYAVEARRACSPASTPPAELVPRSLDGAAGAARATRCARPRPRTPRTRTSSCSPTGRTTAPRTSTRGPPSSSASRSSSRTTSSCAATCCATSGRAVDVVYRRTDADTVDTEVGRLLVPPLRAGTLGLVNAFGTGVADDKLAHAYVEDLVRFHLGEEPLLRSVRDARPVRARSSSSARSTSSRRSWSSRGTATAAHGVVVCPHAEREDVERLRDAADRARPGSSSPSRTIEISLHPTVIDGELQPRHVDLRPFVFLRGDGKAAVMPGGLTRVAFGEGAMVVNSTQNGGAKDTWVLP